MITPQLERIEKGIQELHMKDLKTAQNLFRDAFREMRQKLECFESLSDANLDSCSDEVKNALKDAQKSAIAAISGKLSAADALKGYRVVVATEMLLVLNEATRRRILQAEDKQRLSLQTKRAHEKCNSYLQDANKIVEITDYIASKLEIADYPGGIKWFPGSKGELVVSLVELNLQVANFFHFVPQSYEIESVKIEAGKESTVVLSAIGGSLLTQNNANTTVSTPTIVGLKPLKVLHGLMGANELPFKFIESLVQVQFDGFKEEAKKLTDTASRIAYFELIMNDEVNAQLFAKMKEEKRTEFIESLCNVKFDTDKEEAKKLTDAARRNAFKLIMNHEVNVQLFAKMRNKERIKFVESFGLKDLTDMKNGGIVGGSESRNDPKEAFQSKGRWLNNNRFVNYYFLQRELPSSVTPLLVGILDWSIQKPIRVKILARRKKNKSEKTGKGKDDEAVNLRDSSANVRGAETSLRTDEQENEWMTILDEDGLEWGRSWWKFWRVTSSASKEFKFEFWSGNGNPNILLPRIMLIG